MLHCILHFESASIAMTGAVVQEWIRINELKIVVVFEGRDAAGKGGSIKRITECLNPRICRAVALGKPTEREHTQWYFQRYIKHLPAAGEMVLFDRSWYNCAGVDKVMGFVSDEVYNEFLRSCPEFERMIVRSGIILIKYWFLVSDEVQEKRFQDRLNDPIKRWKLSDMDLMGRKHWVDFSRAEDVMFEYTDTKEVPWLVIAADNKKHARLNCIANLLSHFDYKDIPPKKIKLPEKQEGNSYKRPSIDK